MAKMRSELTLQGFQNEINRMFSGTGMRLQYAQIEQDILRVGFSKPGMEQLVLNLRAGPVTRFGRTIYELTASGKEQQDYVYGPEVIGVGEEQRFLSSEQAFVNYVKGALQVLPGTEYLTPRERFVEIRTFGYWRRGTDFKAAGGIRNINIENHFDRQITDLLESVTIRTENRWEINEAIDQLWSRGKHLREMLAGGYGSLRGEKRYIAEMPGFMQVFTESRERGRMVPMPGQVYYDERGHVKVSQLGGAETVVKREAQLAREPNVHFIEKTADGKIRISEPGYIKERGAAGWLHPNLTVGGLEPPPMFYMPHTLQLPGGTPSGTFLLRGEAWGSYNITTEGNIIGPGYEKYYKLDFPKLGPEGLTSIRITPGFFKEKRGKYVKYAGYGERVIAPGETGIIGLMEWEEEGLEEGEGRFVMNKVVRPIRLTAGTMGISIPEGEEWGLQVSMPYWYNTRTGKPSNWAGRNVASTADIADMLLAGAGGRGKGLNVIRTSTGEITLTLYGVQLSGMAPKGLGGAKGGFAPVAQPPGATAPYVTIPSTGAQEQYWAVTSDIKLATQQFQWGIFAGLPNFQQEQMLRELQYAAKTPAEKNRMEMMVNEMRGYIRGLPERGGTRFPDINELGRIFSTYTGTPLAGSGFNLMDKLRQVVLDLSIKSPSVTMQRYGFAVLPPAWHEIQYLSESEAALEEQAMKEVWGERWKEFGRIRPVPGSPQFVKEIFSYALFGTVASPLAVEYMGNKVRVNRAGAQSIGIEMGEELGVSPTQSPNEMGMMPPAARAWSGMVDVISWWKEKMNPLPSYYEFNRRALQFKLATLAEVKATGIGAWLSKGKTPEQISQFLEKSSLGYAPEMIISDKGEIFPGSRIIDPLATYEYEFEGGAEAVVARLGRQYPLALKDFIEEGTLRQTRESPSMQTRYITEILEPMISTSKEIAKITTGYYPNAGATGRYIYASGMPINVGIISQQTLETALLRKARQLNVRNRREWVGNVVEQMREMGGIPSYNIREPNVWGEYGAITMLLATPEILREQYGLEFPEGTVIRGMIKQQIIPGSPFFTGVLGGFGVATIGQQGDWDLDQMLTLLGVKITKEGITPTKGMLAASKAGVRTLQETVIAAQEEAMGVHAGEVGILQKSYKDIAEIDAVTKKIKYGDIAGMAGGKPMATSEAEGELVQHISRLYTQSKAGMGIAHSMESRMMASGTSLLLSNEIIRKGIIGMGYPYQQYLDYAITEIEKRGGYSALETLFSTSVLSYEPTTGQLSIFGKVRGEDKYFGKVMSTHAMTTEGKSIVPSNASNYGMMETLVWAMGQSGYTPQTIGFLMGMNPEQREEIKNAVARGVPLTDIMLRGLRSIWGRGGYDITQTPIGVAYFTDVLDRALREEQPTSIDVMQKSGKVIKVPVIQATANQPIWWQGRVVALSELQHDPTFQASQIIYKSLTSKVITPSEGEIIANLIDRMYKSGVEPPSILLQIAARHPSQAAVREARAKQLSEEELMQKFTQRVIHRTRGPLTIRASAVPWLALDYEEAGSVYGTGIAGEETWERIRKENEVTLFMNRVLGIPQDIIEKATPRELKDIETMEAGKRFELEYIRKNKAAWEEHGKTLTNIDWKTGTPFVSFRQLAQWGPVADIFSRLIEEHPGIEDWGITGIPDAIRIGPDGQAIIDEMKQITFFPGKKWQELQTKYHFNIPADVKREFREGQKVLKAQSRQVRVQLATYMLAGVATSSISKKDFKKWIDPLIIGSEEYRSIIDIKEQQRYLREARRELYDAFTTGVIGEEVVNIKDEYYPTVLGEGQGLNLSDLAGLASYVATAAGRAYEQWTDPAQAAVLIKKSLNMLQQANINLSDYPELADLAELIVRYPREPGMPTLQKQRIVPVPKGSRRGGRGVRPRGEGPPTGEQPPEAPIDPDSPIGRMIGEFNVSMKSFASPEWQNRILIENALTQIANIQGNLESARASKATPFTPENLVRALTGQWSTETTDPFAVAIKVFQESLAQKKPETLARIQQFFPEIKEAARAWTAIKAGETAAEKATGGATDREREMLRAATIGGATTAEGRKIQEVGEIAKLGAELKQMTGTVVSLNKVMVEHEARYKSLGTEMDKQTKIFDHWTQVASKYEEGTEGHTVAMQNRAIAATRYKLAEVRQQRQLAGEVLTGLEEGTMFGPSVSDVMKKDRALAREEATYVSQLAGEGGQPPAPWTTGRGVSKFFRNLIGGWGLFYMGTLASWPARAMGYGLEQQEQFMAGVTAYAGGQVGTGAVQPYRQLAYDVQRSQIAANAGGMALMQQIQADVPGALRQLGGIAMGGVAGMAAASFGLQAASGILGQKRLEAIAPTVTTLGLIAGTTFGIALNIAGNIARPEQAALSAAADRGTYGNFMGEVSQGINVGIPTDVEVSRYYRNRPFGQIEAWYNTAMRAALATKVNLGMDLTPRQEKWLSNIQNLQNQVAGTTWGFSAYNAADLLSAATSEFLGKTPEITPYQRRELEKVKAEYQRSGQPLYSQQLPAIAQLATLDPRFAKYDPMLVSQAAVRVYAQGAGFTSKTPDLIEQYVKAETIGIPVQQLGALYAETFRMPYNAQTAREAEGWASRLANMYESARYGATLGFMGQAGVAYQRATLAPTASDAAWKAAAMDVADRLRLTPGGDLWTAAGAEARTAEMMGQDFYKPSGDLLASVAGTQSQRSTYQEVFRQYRQQVVANQITQAATDAGISGTMVTQLTNMVRTGSAVQTAQAQRAIQAAQNTASLGLDPNQYSLASSMSVQGGYLNQLQTNVGAILQQQLGTAIGQQTYQSWMVPGGPLATVASTQAITQAFQQNPFRLTQYAMEQSRSAFGYNYSMKYATSDISGRTGRQTGLTWGATGLARGNVPMTEMANRIWGFQVGTGIPNWALSEVGTAMTAGYTPQYAPEYGELFGEQAYQQMQSDLSYSYQLEQFGFQQKGIALQREYVPQFRNLQRTMAQHQYGQAMRGFGIAMAGVGVQFAQIQLGHRQFAEQMMLQEEQWAMQGSQFGRQQALQLTQFTAGQALQLQQFQQNIGIQQRQMGMQRAWAREDWAYQGQVREMQWGWRQEDFQEQARFMTGRERRLAERQMGRETIMYGMEGEQIEKQKKRQEEIWKLEDERFTLQKKQFLEQMQLQKQQFNESRELQKQFFDEQHTLQRKNLDLQKKQEEERYKLQLAAAGVQAASIQASIDAYKENYEDQIKLRDLQWEYEDKQLQLREDELIAAEGYAKQMKKNNDDYMQYLRDVAKLIGENNLALLDYQQFVDDTATAIDNLAIKVATFQTQVNNFDWSRFWPKAGGSGGGGGGASKPQTGTLMTVPPGFPNEGYTMHVSTGETVMVVPADKGIRHNNANWNNIVGNSIMSASSPSERTALAGTMVLILNVGNERLGRYILRTVSQELEV